MPCAKAGKPYVDNGETLTIAEEAYELLPRKMKTKESFSEAVKAPGRERGKLNDSFGAWTMSDEEEERIFSSLKKNWKRTTLAIRRRVRIGEQAHNSNEKQV